MQRFLRSLCLSELPYIGVHQMPTEIAVNECLQA